VRKPDSHRNRRALAVPTGYRPRAAARHLDPYR
jgi:hypothetical protein